MARTLANDRKRYATKLARSTFASRSPGGRALELVDIADGNDIVLSLLAVADLRRLVNELEAGAVARARASRLGWRQIGEALGAGKSAVWERHRSVGIMGMSESSDTQVVA